MPVRSVVFLLSAVILVAGAVAVAQCARSSRLPGVAPRGLTPGVPEAAPTFDPMLVRCRVLLLSHAGAGVPEGVRLLALAEEVAGGVIAPDQLRQFDADLGVLAAAGLASIISSPAAMIASGQEASIRVGQIGTAPASAFRLDLDLLALSFADGSVRGVYTLRVAQQAGAIEVTLADLGLPVGDRGVVGIITAAKSGDTLLGLRELPRSSDLGAAIILLVAPQVAAAPPAPAPGAEIHAPGEGGGVAGGAGGADAGGDG